MGQKVCPIGFRLVHRKKWRSMWYANAQEFKKFIGEDAQIRQYLAKKGNCQGASDFTIQRMRDKIEVTIHTSRPGLVIGKKGAEIQKLKEELCKLTGKEVWLAVEEVKRPDLSAQLIADNVAKQLEPRVPVRWALKKSLQAVMEAGAHGVRIRVAGRLGGAEIARAEWSPKGRVPLHTLKAEIDYATATAFTTYGCIGVKVWINQGDVLTAHVGGR